MGMTNNLIISFLDDRFLKTGQEKADLTVPGTAILSAWSSLREGRQSLHFVELYETITRYFGENVLDGLLG
jgi:hypothetical protein